MRYHLKYQKNVFCCYLKFTNRAYHGKINTATCDGLQYCTNFYQNVEWLNRQWHIIQTICRVIFTLHLNIILFNFKNVQMYCVLNLSFFFFLIIFFLCQNTIFIVKAIVISFVSHFKNCSLQLATPFYYTVTHTKWILIQNINAWKCVSETEKYK